MSLPILWSFRRCPYAMRARLAVAVSEQQVELREMVLRAKPDAFLTVSPSATVPCLETGTDIIDESFDIMLWALGRNDPEQWLDMPQEGHTLITNSDGPFKQALDFYKYASRHPDKDGLKARGDASKFLSELDKRLHGQAYLFGSAPRLADMAILPFVRQFAHVDLDWLNAQDWPDLIRWLEGFKASQRFQAIMPKLPAWTPVDTPLLFP